MTSKRLEKLLGHRVRIEKQKFRHSVEREILTGELLGAYGYHGVTRDGCTKQYKHVDFYVDDEKHDKMILIEWNQIDTIVRVDDLGVIEYEKID